MPAGFRPENKRLFQMPTRLVATTMQEQHPTQPVVSPLQPRTPLASHIRRNRRRPALRRNLNSVLAMSPGSPESPVRSGFLSVGFADTSPLGSRGPTPGSSKGFRWVLRMGRTLLGSVLCSRTLLVSNECSYLYYQQTWDSGGNVASQTEPCFGRRRIIQCDFYVLSRGTPRCDANELCILRHHTTSRDA